MMKIGGTIALAALLSGCASGSLRYAGANQPASGPGEREAAQIGWNCTQPTLAPDPESGGSALIGAVAGIAVDAVLGAISESLARMKKARTGIWTAASAIDLMNDDGSPACMAGTMTIRRAAFDGSSDQLVFGTYPAFDLTMDVKIEPSGKKNEGLVLTFKPVNLDYAETAAASRGSKRKEVIVSLELGAVGTVPTVSGEDGGAAAKDEKPAADAKPASAKPAANAILLNLGKLQIGREYKAFGLESALAVAQAPKHNVAVIVTESEDASVALTALAAAFEKNKDGLGTAMKDAIKDAIGKDSK